LLALALPIAAAICVLAGPIIRLIYGEAFAPAVPALQVSIWAAVFLLVNVPNARLLLVDNRQGAAAGLTAVSMTVNIIANLALIPLFGIVGAAMARVIASAAFFLSIHLYVRANILRSHFWPLLPRPLLATAIMVAAMWPAREWPLIVPLLIGAAVYAGTALLLGVVPAGDLVYWRQALRSRAE
jgi:O-antigen/teichoic acid export membrane protein